MTPSLSFRNFTFPSENAQPPSATANFIGFRPTFSLQSTTIGAIGAAMELGSTPDPVIAVFRRVARRSATLGFTLPTALNHREKRGRCGS
jgi:hypothetical protein